MSKRYGLRRRLKRVAKASGITVPNDWSIDQIADAIADAWNAEGLIQPPVEGYELSGTMPPDVRSL